MEVPRCICGCPLPSPKNIIVRFPHDNCDICGHSLKTRHHDSAWINNTQYSNRLQRGNNRCKPSKIDTNISIFQFFTNSLSVSSINGISNCASARTGFRRLLWLMVFLGCLSGYCYQTYHFYIMYSDEPTEVNIEVDNEGHVEFPAVTICNTNRFRKSAYCQRFPDRCPVNPENLTVSEYQMNKLTYNLLLNKEGHVIQDLGHQKSMIITCDFQGYPYVSEKECVSIVQRLRDPEYGNCYTIPSENKDGLSLIAREADFWQDINDMSFLVDIEPKEFMEYDRQAGIIIVVHDENTLPDIQTDGLMLLPGYSYSIGIRKSTVVLLPPPYKMNCTNYFKLPWQRNERRRLTSRMCTVGCSQHFQLEECKYVQKNLSLFYEALPYEVKDITEKAKKCAKLTEARTLDYCRTICGLPCRDPIFSTRIESTPLAMKLITHYSLFHELNRNVSLKKDLVHARVFYSSFEHRIYKHMPKHDTMELFGFLGGYSGVWLGFSLLTVYEMVEIIVCTFFFAVGKCRRNRQNNRVSRTVLNFRKNTKGSVRTYKKKRHKN